MLALLYTVFKTNINRTLNESSELEIRQSNSNIVNVDNNNVDATPRTRPKAREMPRLTLKTSRTRRKAREMSRLTLKTSRFGLLHRIIVFILHSHDIVTLMLCHIIHIEHSNNPTTSKRSTISRAIEQTIISPFSQLSTSDFNRSAV